MMRDWRPELLRTVGLFIRALLRLPLCRNVVYCFARLVISKYIRSLSLLYIWRPTLAHSMTFYDSRHLLHECCVVHFLADMSIPSRIPQMYEIMMGWHLNPLRQIWISKPFSTNLQENISFAQRCEYCVFLYPFRTCLNFNAVFHLTT